MNWFELGKTWRWKYIHETVCPVNISSNKKDYYQFLLGVFGEFQYAAATNKTVLLDLQNILKWFGIRSDINECRNCECTHTMWVDVKDWKRVYDDYTQDYCI